MSSQPQPAGGYSLFPNPNSNPNPNGQPPSSWRPPSRTRRSESQERSGPREPAPGTGSEANSVPALHPIDTAPPRADRRTPQRRERPSGESTRSPQDARQSPADGHPRSGPRRERTPVLVQHPPPASSIPPRSDTAFSEAQTLVRDNSNRSRSSIAKLPINDGPSASSSLPSSQQQPARSEQPLRSIFPQYDPEVPLSRQDYFPTQTSPTHIPRAVISRAGYQPQGEEDVDAQSPAVAMGSPVTTMNQRHPASRQTQSATMTSWPKRNNLEMPPLPVESSTEQLKGLWKVLNGWRATAAEGRVFCMKLSQEKDAPVYTLSSKQQPFYNLRLDPTSVAAHVTLSRHDPSKPYKAPSSPSSTSGVGGNGGGGGGSSSSSILNNVVGKDPAVKASAAAAESSKNWQEALSTTLEEESRRHRPNDGLVALLYPTAAAKLALDRPSDAHAVAAAEGECARLVWDDDAAAHFLCHPALATPFCVTIERNPAWSRVEYTLEHHESPQHVAKLTRDGTGAGWLEVDTAVAGRIESFFVLDVAVAALLIVAAGDERTRQVETFEPPPLPSPALLAGGRGGRRGTDGGSKRSSFLVRGARRKGSARKMDEFEIDIESQSQDHEFAKFEQATKKTRRKLPWPLRFTFKVLGGLFKCFIWTLTVFFKTVVAIVVGLAKCTGLASKGG